MYICSLCYTKLQYRKRKVYGHQNQGNANFGCVINPLVSCVILRENTSWLSVKIDILLMKLLIKPLGSHLN